MPAPVWPPSLPQLLLKRAYSETFPDLGVQTEMEGGIPKDRRRFSANVRPISGIEIMDDDQLQDFLNFWLNELEGGSLVFQWTEHRTYQDTSTPLVTDTSAPTVTDTSTVKLPTAFNTAYFKFNKKDGPPSAREAGGKYEVSLSLLMLP